MKSNICSYYLKKKVVELILDTVEEDPTVKNCQNVGENLLKI